MRPEIGDRSPKKQTNKYIRRTDVKEGEERWSIKRNITGRDQREIVVNEEEEQQEIRDRIIRIKEERE
jgi:hypothetical protein